MQVGWEQHSLSAIRLVTGRICSSRRIQRLGCSIALVHMRLYIYQGGGCCSRPPASWVLLLTTGFEFTFAGADVHLSAPSPAQVPS
jgi:hypothetical protein